MQSLEEGTRAWPGAVIAVTMGRDDPFFRPAAFVFDTAGGGVAWVEPSYADPHGAASPAFHRFDGDRSTWNVVNGEGWKVEVLEYDSVDHQDLEGIGSALEWFADWLKDQGRTLAQERERVRATIAANLQG